MASPSREVPNATKKDSISSRVVSIDVLRGITILAMLLLNDAAGVTGTPAWLKHFKPSDGDGMTFVDVIFPAFLFIVGMSIPLSIGRRLDQGESLLRVQGHVLLRTLGLLVIGVFMVNQHAISEEGRLSPSVWTLLSYLGILLLWNSWNTSTDARQKFAWGMRGLGAALLVVLAILFRGEGEPGFIEMRPSWWGILGLIGWANLVASYVYLLLRNQLAGLIGAMCLLHCVFAADWAGGFPELWLTQWIDVASALGSHAAIVVAGVVLGVLLRGDSPIQSPAARIRWTVLYGCGLALGAYLLHLLHDVDEMFFLNKINATPPWCLWSSAITAWIWAAVYWVVDVQGIRRWSVFFRAAGQNALFIYMLVPILYAAIDLWQTSMGTSAGYWELGSQFNTGFTRAVVQSLAVAAAAIGLRRVGVLPRL